MWFMKENISLSWKALSTVILYSIFDPDFAKSTYNRSWMKINLLLRIWTLKRRRLIRILWHSIDSYRWSNLFVSLKLDLCSSFALWWGCRGYSKSAVNTPIVNHHPPFATLLSLGKSSLPSLFSLLQGSGMELGRVTLGIRLWVSAKAAVQLNI